MSKEIPPLVERPAWKGLAAHRDQTVKLHLRQLFRSCHNALQTLIVQFVGSSSSRASIKSCPHRDNIILLRYILMDGVVGKSGQRRMPAVDESFHLVRTRILFYFPEDVSSFVFI